MQTVKNRSQLSKGVVTYDEIEQQQQLSYQFYFLILQMADQDQNTFNESFWAIVVRYIIKLSIATTSPYQ